MNWKYAGSGGVAVYSHLAVNETTNNELKASCAWSTSTSAIPSQGKQQTMNWKSMARRMASDLVMPLKQQTMNWKDKHTSETGASSSHPAETTNNELKVHWYQASGWRATPLRKKQQTMNWKLYVSRATQVPNSRLSIPRNNKQWIERGPLQARMGRSAAQGWNNKQWIESEHILAVVLSDLDGEKQQTMNWKAHVVAYTATHSRQRATKQQTMNWKDDRLHRLGELLGQVETTNNELKGYGREGVLECLDEATQETTNNELKVIRWLNAWWVRVYTVGNNKQWIERISTISGPLDRPWAVKQQTMNWKTRFFPIAWLPRPEGETTNNELKDVALANLVHDAYHDRKQQTMNWKPSPRSEYAIPRSCSGRKQQTMNWKPCSCPLYRSASIIWNNKQWIESSFLIALLLIQPTSSKQQTMNWKSGHGRENRIQYDRVPAKQQTMNWKWVRYIDVSA